MEFRFFPGVFRLCLQKASLSRRIYSPYSHVFRRRLDQDPYIRLGHTSSRRVQDVLPRRFQKVFKTSSRRLAKTSSRRFQDIFKTFLKRLQDVLQKCLQDIFKTYHQVKLFLLTRFQDDSETYSKRFWDVLQRRLTIEGFP